MDLADAERLQRTVEEVTGEPCPCEQGKQCPLLPREGLQLVRRGVRSLPIVAKAAALVTMAAAGGHLRYLYDVLLPAVGTG